MAIGIVNVGMNTVANNGNGESHDNCIDKDQLGKVNGVATLDESGKLKSEQHPGAVVDVLDSDPVSPKTGYMWVVNSNGESEQTQEAE